MLTILLMLFITAIIWFATNSYIYRDYRKSDTYGSWGVWGKIGTGKTTLMQKFNKIHFENGWKCFANINMTNAQKLPEEFWIYKYPRNSLIQIDEASFQFLNRSWKNTPIEFIKFLKGARHDGIKVIFYSQTADLDLKIREACDRMYLLKKIWLFSVARAIQVDPTILNNGSVGNPDLKGKGTGFGDMYSFIPVIQKKAMILTFIPRWSAYFDSFEELMDDREEIEYTLKPNYDIYSKKWYRRYKRKYWKDSIGRSIDETKKNLKRIKLKRS